MNQAVKPPASDSVQSPAPAADAAGVAGAANEPNAGKETNAAKEKGQPPLRSDQPTPGIIAAVKGNFKFFLSILFEVCIVLIPFH